MSLKTLPMPLRAALKEIGHPRIWGHEIAPWARGKRYRSGKDVIYTENGEPVSIRRGTEFIWRKEGT